MSSISAKINLTTLKSVITKRKGKSGEVEGIFIPIEANHLFKSEKGNVYLDLNAFELKEKKEDGDTHLIKQSLPKDVYKSMSDDEKRELPIIGNLKVWGAVSSNETEVEEYDDESDLPF